MSELDTLRTGLRNLLRSGIGPHSDEIVDGVIADFEAAVGEKVAQTLEAAADKQEYGMTAMGYRESACIVREVTGGAS